MFSCRPLVADTSWHDESITADSCLFKLITIEFTILRHPTIYSLIVIVVIALFMGISMFNTVFLFLYVLLLMINTSQARFFSSCHITAFSKGGRKGFIWCFILLMPVLGMHCVYSSDKVLKLENLWAFYLLILVYKDNQYYWLSFI